MGLILAETEGFEPSMRLYTPYSLSRGKIYSLFLI